MIQIRGLTCRVAGRTLLRAANATIPSGHRVGLVGRNGTGKTTLLNLIAGRLQPDEGEIGLGGLRGRHGAIGMVEQEAPGGAATVLQTVLAADRERSALLAAAEQADPRQAAEIQSRLRDIAAHAAPARAARILSGLGFDTAMQGRPMAGYSGGWRMRVALAALLFTEPEILLLDEPTNHLDLEATVWLEAFLKRHARTMILVSHDRDLLNRTVDSILHLEQETLTLYAGGYDRFEAVRDARLAHQAALRKKQEARRRHMQAFIDRFRYKESKARQAQSRIKAIERMAVIPAATLDPETSFRFASPVPLAPPLIRLEGASAGYAPGRPVLRRLDLAIDQDDRIGVLGRNGNGKTTLARVIAGKLAPEGGRSHRAASLRVGFFEQHQIEALEPAATAFDHLARLMPDALPRQVRDRLGGVGLTQQRQLTPAGDLSGGERARLALALVTHDAPHILILDEPTNHLDIDARQALAHALGEFAGAVIIISHDHRLLELSVDRLWLVEGGRVTPFEGDLDAYRRRIAGEPGAESGAEAPPPAGRPEGNGAAGNPRRRERQAAAERRRRTADIRRTAQAAQRRVERLSAERSAMERRLAAPGTYDRPGEALRDLLRRKAALDRDIEAAEAEWLRAEEALEDAT